MSDTEHSQLCDMAAGLPNSSRLLLVGERWDLPEWLCSADLLLVTSMREGLPGVVLEAVAAGTPVVASDLPGVRWLEEFSMEYTRFL